MFGLVWAKSHGFLWDCPCQTKQYRPNDLISWMCSHFQSGNSAAPSWIAWFLLVSTCFAHIIIDVWMGWSIHVNSFNFLIVLVSPLVLLRMPYLPIFLFIRPLTRQLFNFRSYIILIRPMFFQKTFRIIFKQVEKKPTSPKAVLFEPLDFHLYFSYRKTYGIWMSDPSPACRDAVGRRPWRWSWRTWWRQRSATSRGVYGEADSWPLLCSSKLENCWGIFLGGIFEDGKTDVNIFKAWKWWEKDGKMMVI